jgi:hypothetical protein
MMSFLLTFNITVFFCVHGKKAWGILLYAFLMDVFGFVFIRSYFSVSPTKGLYQHCKMTVAEALSNRSITQY